jgi:glutathione synthase
VALAGRDGGGPVNVVVIADPVERLDAENDTTLALIAAACGRGHHVVTAERHELAIRDGRAAALVHELTGSCGPRWVPLDDADVVLFRTDPPVDRPYLDATLILDRVDATRTVLVNDPRGIRLANEKLWALAHPDLCPPTLVAADAGLIAEFVAEHRRCVVKPIDGHAGRGVLRLDATDPNHCSIVELVTERGSRPVVVQPWLDEVEAGNKRIFLHGGEPAGAVLRHPAGGDFRIGMPDTVAALTDRDREICARIGPELDGLGLVLVGLDVIGEWLIEVNVTSSGALHKADRLLGTSLCPEFIDLLETMTTTRRTP